MKGEPCELAEDKRHKIIEAAMKEFAENGYEKASTNNIIKNAQVSKGLLFHYFGNKKKLYFYIIDYCLDYFENYFYQCLEHYSTDILERAMQWGKAKLKIFHENPSLYNLMIAAFIDIPEELKYEMEARYQQIFQQNSSIFLKDIDMSKFRDDIDPNRALQFVMVMFDAMSQHYIQTYKQTKETEVDNLQKYFEDYENYIDMLRYGLYKRKDVEEE